MPLTFGVISHDHSENIKVLPRGVLSFYMCEIQFYIYSSTRDDKRDYGWAESVQCSCLLIFAQRFRDKMAETKTLDYLGSEAMKTQIFSASEVAKRLPMVKCIESTSEALKALSSGKGMLTL